MSTGARRQPGLEYLTRDDTAPVLVLLAPGGEEQSHREPGRFGYAAARMWPWARAARAAFARAGCDGSVAVLRYRYAGWNGDDADAAADLAVALDDLQPRHQRVIVIGHSMGGRAVLAAGNAPCVIGALVFAPWVPGDEPLTDFGDRPVVLAHGTLDRWCDPRTTRDYAHRLRAESVPAAMLNIAGDGHALMRRSLDTDEVVRRTVTHLLAGPDPWLEQMLTRGCGDPPDYLPRWHRGLTARFGMATGLADALSARLRLPVRTVRGIG